MKQFSYMLRFIWGSHDTRNELKSEAAKMRLNYKNAVLDVDKNVHDILQNADRSLWRCDPDSYEEGTTYLQLTRLLQGHIENEKDLNSERSCRGSCEDYEGVIGKNFGCSDNSICNSQTICNGILLSCSSIPDSMSICFAHENSSRRYEYIAFSNRAWGKQEKCEGKSNQVSIR